MAAHRQGKFWEMHDKLFQDTKTLTPETFDKYASELGLNMARFKKDMADPALARQIDADQALANQLGARGTPAFFINGKNMRGAQPFEAFKAKIDEEMKKADDLLKKGVPAAKLYDEIIKTGLDKIAAAPAGAPGAPGVAANVRYKVDVGNSPMKGSKTAKVTLVEWSEFQ
jgi:protein-disulfide isomerase